MHELHDEPGFSSAWLSKPCRLYLEAPASGSSVTALCSSTTIAHFRCIVASANRSRVFEPSPSSLSSKDVLEAPTEWPVQATSSLCPGLGTVREHLELRILQHGLHSDVAGPVPIDQRFKRQTRCEQRGSQGIDGRATRHAQPFSYVCTDVLSAHFLREKLIALLVPRNAN